MPPNARKDIFIPDEVGVYHCYSRCVRRSHLCGVDDYTGNDYSYRLKWFDDRVQQLAQVFMVDVLSHAILDNHFHAMLRNRPDLVEKLSDREVARRSLLLSSNSMPEDKKLTKPTRKQIDAAANDPEHIKKWRDRLSHISWYMKYMKEPIARRANAEDEVTGHFWEGRFKSVPLLDVTALVICSVYIDLNEVRAGVAETPEESKNSSIYQRIVSWTASRKRASKPFGKKARNQARGSKKEPAPDWLAPICEDSDNGTQTGFMRDEKPDPDRLRPSNSGFLPMTVEQYMELVDWTGRCARSDKRGAISKRLAPIMSRLASNLDAFLIATQNFQSLFKRVCGAPAAVEAHGQTKGLKKVHGLPAARQLFAGES